MTSPLREADRVTTEQIQRLLERCNARHNHITDEQLLAFMMNPGGPIMPNNCLEARRLPDNWGNENIAVWHLTVTPDGKPCMVTKFHGKTNAVVCGDQTYELNDDQPETSHGPQITYEATVMGFSSSGQPLIHVLQRATESTFSDKHFHTRMTVPEWRVGHEGVQHLVFEQMIDQQKDSEALNEMLAEHRLPCFERVSPPFKRHGRWFYYGVRGRWLFTMELPEPETCNL